MFGELKAKAAAALLKPHVGSILRTIVELILKEAGQPDGAHAGALLWEAKRANGTPTLMARVYLLDALDQPTEEVGMFDVLKRAEEIDLAAFVTED